MKKLNIFCTRHSNKGIATFGIITTVTLLSASIFMLLPGSITVHVDEVGWETDVNLEKLTVNNCNTSSINNKVEDSYKTHIWEYSRTLHESGTDENPYYSTEKLKDDEREFSRLTTYYIKGDVEYKAVLPFDKDYNCKKKYTIDADAWKEIKPGQDVVVKVFYNHVIAYTYL